ncbi:MAG: DNA polymerase III subunit gamma/tau [Clostridiales bacterium]|nr:DNA polymerase III subunit gamma/tau [Clostridiales bacterium]
MYQSLYRTWRVRTFSEMVGQEHVVRTLKNQADKGHIAHAYLFSGTRGTGKTSAARILAMAINCLNPELGDPCLKCEACQSLLSDATLDVIEMDAASNSSVNEIRDMLERVNYPPQFVRRKVYIIDEVHMLSNAAFNALLKTLEEPPAYMVFILATTEPQKIPATILSRCQRFDFGRIREKDIIGRLRVALKPGQQAEEEALQLIASAAEGSMRDAWSLMDMCLDEEGDLSEQRVREALGTVDRGFLFSFAAALARRQAREAFVLIDQMLQSGKDIQVFLKDFSAHLRQLIAAKLAQSGPAAPDERLERYRQQADEIPLDKLVWMLERAVRAEGDLRWVSQQRSVLEVYALSVCELGDQSDPLALQARLTELEQALSALQSGGIPRHLPRVEAPKDAIETPPPPPPMEQVPAPIPDEAPAMIEPPVQEEPAAPPEAPPQAAQAPAPAPAAPETNHKQIWNGMLDRAKKELPNIYSMMSEGKFGGSKEGVYLLRFPADKQFYIGFLMAEARRAQIEAILSELSGQPARFEALAEDTAPAQKDARRAAEQDIQALSAVFGRQNIIVTGGEQQEQP